MILYKKDSKGKIRFVEIYSNENKVIQKHGIIDGKVVYNESECVGKNIGKSNETTPERQAELEAQSKLLKKLDEGYYKTIDEANNETVVLPMLAKDFKDIACEIIDVTPSEKRPTHGIFVCEHNGVTFGCGMKFPHKFREEVLINKEDYIGSTAEIRFFEYTDDGAPRFPVCVGIRLDV